MADDPKNWSKVKSSAGGEIFYYNRVTKAAQWEKPKMMSQGSSNNGSKGEPKRRKMTRPKVYGVWNNKVQ